jgi:MoaD family protein
MLKEITGKKEETLTFQTRKPITVKQILSKLSKEYGEDFNEYVYNADTGEVRGFLQFLINGRSVSLENDTNAELYDGDVLAIIPPVSGG